MNTKMMNDAPSSDRLSTREELFQVIELIGLEESADARLSHLDLIADLQADASDAVETMESLSEREEQLMLETEPFQSHGKIERIN